MTTPVRNLRNDTRNDAPFDASAIEQALASNLKLQVSLKRELERIAATKASNRALTAHWTNQLTQVMRNSTTPSLESTSPKPNASSKGAGATEPDLKRKWTRRFFFDAKSRKVEPKPNPDTVRRRAIETNYFFHHLQPPWSKKESDALLAAVQTSKGQSIDFGTVAATLEQGQKKNARTHLRSEEECRAQYELLNRQTSLVAFTKPELQIISDRIQRTTTSDIPWNDMATQLSTRTQKRTAWDCLVAYHAKIKSSPNFSTTSAVWTVLEDELLFKFLAAAGPQTVVDSKNMLIQMTVLNHLLPRKTKKQIFNRINMSLLNPNLKRSEWSDQEERRLPIFMKIYHTPNVPHEPSAFRSDLFLASTHCHGRVLKSVADKWNRSINPDFSSRPFTAADDQALLDVLRLPANAALGWKLLSERHFPDRHPQRLLNRWSELARDEDILQRERALQLAGPVVRNRKRPLTDTETEDD